MPHRRGPWSPGEDNYLLRLVHSQGANNWVRISNLIGSRSPKQCRERYHQNLKPTLNHDPITPEEGILIERLVGEMGKRWAEIARRLDGRSDNAVKNWWNGGMNRRRRLVGHRRRSDSLDHPFDERMAKVSFARPANTAAYPPGPLMERHIHSTVVQAPGSRGAGTPLPSPSTASDVSNAPSLVSDNGSAFSTASPRQPVSPAVELPPLIGSRVETRRPSLPVLQLGSSKFASERQQLHPLQTSPEELNRYHQNHGQNYQPMAYSRSPADRLHELGSSSRHFMREHATVSPVKSILGQQSLPSFLTVTALLPTERQDKDSRMSLSALCD